jgi:ketosteroid isomerase-like protein
MSEQLEDAVQFTRGSLLLLSLVCAAAPAAPCRGEQAPESPMATIENWAKAFITNDAGRLLRFYEPSESLTVLLASGHQIKSFATLKKTYEKAHENVAFSESEVSEVTARQSGDVAWVVCRHRAKLRALTDDVKLQIDIRVSFVLKRHKEGWRIVLEHGSPIADVPSIKPVEE